LDSGSCAAAGVRRSGRAARSLPGGSAALRTARSARRGNPRAHLEAPQVLLAAPGPQRQAQLDLPALVREHDFLSLAHALANQAQLPSGVPSLELALRARGPLLALRVAQRW